MKNEAVGMAGSGIGSVGGWGVGSQLLSRHAAARGCPGPVGKVTLVKGPWSWIVLKGPG